MVTYPPRQPRISLYRLQQKLRNFIIHLILVSLAIICLIPILLIVSASFSDEIDIAKYGYPLIPRHFTAFAYEYILKVPQQIMRGYGVTLTVTIVGTAISMLMMSMLAYVLSRNEYKYRRSFSLYVFFTMLFNGGLVPWYIWVTQYLKLKDTIWALILPYLVVPWYVLLLRTYFAQLPSELLDAARIDGASEIGIFFRIVVPISTPALATVGLFCILQYWNDWWLALMLIDKQALQPLQYMLYAIMTNARAIQAQPQTTGIRLPLNTVRMAMAVLASGPAMAVFLFLQRFFIRGITLGSLK